MARALSTRETNDRQTILLLEGESYVSGATWTGNITAANQSNLLTIPGNVGKPYVFLDSEIWLTSTKDVRLFFSANEDPTGVVTGTVANVNIPAGAAVPYRYPQRAYSNGDQISMYGDASQVDVPVKIGGVFSGTRVVNDLNFNAEKKVYWLGDSITAFTSNDIGMENYYQFQVRNWLSLNSKQTYRLTQKAWGGRTSTHFNTLREYGSLYIDNPDIIFYQLGVNDQSQSTGTVTYRANIERIIAYKNTFWKDAILIFLGSTPVQDTARHTALDAYRSVMQQVVEEAGQENVKYISLREAFDRTATPTTIWATSDNPGTNTDCIHPGTLISHSGIANAIITGLQYLNVKI